MECHEARMLLAFARPGSDAIDATERAAIQQHLEACADCAAHARSEQAIDAAFGTAMREVTIPAGLKARVLAKVAAHRPFPWPTVAAAAAILLVVAGLGAWWMWPLPRVDTQYAVENANRDTDPDRVEAWFKAQGVEMVTWRQLDHRQLWSYDVAEFRGRRVAKLVFLNRAQPAIAQVIVLRTSQFNTTNLDNGFGQTNRVIVERESNPGFVFLVSTDQETLDAFMIPRAN